MLEKPNFSTKNTMFFEVVHLVRVLIAARERIVENNDPDGAARILLTAIDRYDGIPPAPDG